MVALNEFYPMGAAKHNDNWWPKAKRRWTQKLEGEKISVSDQIELKYRHQDLVVRLIDWVQDLLANSGEKMAKSVGLTEDEISEIQTVLIRPTFPTTVFNFSGWGEINLSTDLDILIFFAKLHDLSLGVRNLKNQCISKDPILPQIEIIVKSFND